MSDTRAVVGWSEATEQYGLAEVFAAIHEGAALRDKERGNLHEPVAWLKERGIGILRVPRELGGAGASLTEFYRILEDLAFADPNVAHILRNHFFLTNIFLRAPEGSFAKDQLGKVLDRALFGFSFTEQATVSAGIQGESLVLKKVAGDGYVLNGQRIYSTGNAYVDYIWVFTSDEQGQGRYAVVPRSREGLDTSDDWDGFGQRLTASGRTVFHQVRVAEDEASAADDESFANEPTYKSTFTQLYMTTIISGIVRNVLHDAKTEVLRRRNYHHGLALAPKDDPIVQATIGWISARSFAISAVVARAALALEQAWGPSGSDEQRNAWVLEASLDAARAKVFVDGEAALTATRLFDAGGASSASAQLSLDRHWRNIRTLASHNPATFKERLIGDHELNGALPPNSVTFF